MLDWISGNAGSAPEKTAQYDIDQSFGDDQPETPAHLFAVRAFKSALFGTPAPPPTTRPSRELSLPNNVPKQVPLEARQEKTTTIVLEHPKEDNTKRLDVFASPSKGILLTPGTGAARRKSVSFGGIQRVNHPQPKDQDDCVVLPQSDDSRSRDVEQINNKEKDLRRTLFQKKTVNSTTASAPTNPTQSVRLQHKPKQAVDDNEIASKSHGTALQTIETSADVTIDLKSPRSRSGQHWKREYQRDHDKSKLEMRKLIRYSQAAKSYAIKRDQEAIRLGAKLKQTEEEVKEMEGKVSGLASQLAGARLRDDNQERILEDLATQTAQALRYKQKAERYRIALRESQPAASIPDDTLQLTGDNIQSQLSSHSQVNELRRAAEQAQRRVTELERKNASLRQNLQKAKEDMKQNEERHQKSIERRKRREDVLVAEKKALKEQLAKTKSQNVATSENAKAPERSFNRLEKRPRSPEGLAFERNLDLRPKTSLQQVVSENLPLHSVLQERSMEYLNGKDIISERLPRRGVPSQETKFTRSSYRSPLGHVERNASSMNQALSERSIEIARGVVAPLESSDIWMAMEDSNSPQLPPKLPTITNRAANRDDDPWLDGNSHTPVAQTRTKRDPVLSSSLSIGNTVRKPLPADRVAAAKRRIQQRMVDKRKTQTQGKENVPSAVLG